MSPDFVTKVRVVSALRQNVDLRQTRVSAGGALPPLPPLPPRPPPPPLLLSASPPSVVASVERGVERSVERGVALQEASRRVYFGVAPSEAQTLQPPPAPTAAHAQLHARKAMAGVAAGLAGW